MSGYWFQNRIARWDWRNRNASGHFVNTARPGTGDVDNYAGWAGTDMEIVGAYSGQGLLLDGTKQQWHTADSFANFGPQNFTVEAWFKIEDFTHNNYILRKHNGATTGYEILVDTNGAVTINTGDGAGLDTTTSNNGVIGGAMIYQLIVTRIGTAFDIYVNGRQVGIAAAGTHDAIASALAEPLYVFARNAATLNLDGYGLLVSLWDSRSFGATDVWSRWMAKPMRL